MSVLSLADAKLHLGITVATYDVELQGFIDAAEAAITNYVGPLVVGSATTVRVAGGNQLVLPAAPVGAVTAIVTPDGQTVDLATVTVIQASGLVYFKDDLTGFSSDVYDVTFTSGWTAVPADLMFAIKELVRHLWTTQRGAVVRGADADGNPMPGFLLPNRVEQLIEPYRHIGIGAA